MLNISFDFDEATHKVTNVKVTGVEEVKKEPVIIGDHDLVVLEGKLQLTTESVEKLKAVTGDRIAINYWYNGPSDAYPIISKAEMFDGSDGNKLVKSKTISFRGEQRDTLLKYGTVFSFEEWVDKTGKVKEGVFKLVPVKEDDTAEEEKMVEELEKEIDSTTSEEIEDDLSFLFED